MNHRHRDAGMSRRGQHSRGRTTACSVGALILTLSLLATTGCAPKTGTGATDNLEEAGFTYTRQSDETVAGFDLDKLIAAAKEEGEITVYDTTGKIADSAEGFTNAYGIKATGVKMKASEEIEKVTREAAAKNVVGDVVMIDDIPGLINQLLKPGYLTNWVPGAVSEKIPAELQSPLVMVQDPHVWAYNTEVYDTCPITNMWQLTDAEWKGKVMLEDPLNKPVMAYWFNQMADHGDAELRAAYKEYAGEELTTTEDSASAEWVKRLLANKPVSVKTSEESSSGVGAPGQTDPPVAMIATAKFRDNADKGYQLGICDTLTPWVGEVQNKSASIATGSSHPNAAKLFVYYMFTQEGIDPQIADGKFSTNPDVVQPDDPSNVKSVFDKLFFMNSATAANDWANLEKWQDLWRLNS